MGIRKYKPTSPGRRGATVGDFAELTAGAKPEKSLLRPLKKKGGRNNQGKITCRHRGGGHKRQYRVIDFRRQKDGVPAKVHSIQYDPNRSARIALLHYADGEKRYILAPDGLKAGDQVISGPESPPSLGNCVPLKNLPLGTTVHCVEMQPGRGRGDLPQRGLVGHAGGSRGGLGPDIAAQRGDSPCPLQVPRYGRQGQQPGAHGDSPRQGGPQAMAGAPSPWFAARR